MMIFVIDNDPNNTVAQLQDTSQIEKYKMSEDAYNQREQTYRKYKEQQATAVATIEEQELQNIHVGDACDIPSEDGSLRAGEVAYKGPIDGSKGFWVGVKLSLPQGKNDGSVKGTRYFTCETNHGVFVKPNKIILRAHNHTTTQAVQEV